MGSEPVDYEEKTAKFKKDLTGFLRRNPERHPGVLTDGFIASGVIIGFTTLGEVLLREIFEEYIQMSKEKHGEH